MLVKEFMTKRVISIRPDESLEKAYDKMQKNHIHHLLVLDGVDLIGVLSDRDILQEKSPFLGTYNEDKADRETLAKKVHQIMTRSPVTIHEEDEAHVAVEKMKKHNISCLPVMNENNKLVGILTWRNFAKCIKK